MKDYSGKTAFITGGAGGIGLALAKALGQRGIRVMLADVDAGGLATAKAALTAEGVEADTVICDVSDAKSMADAAQATLERFGNVHFVANNAGVSLGGPTGEIAIEDWNWIVNINLMGVVHGVEAFVPILIEQGEGGAILNTASMAGHLAMPGGGPYNATKYAVVGYSETIRQELAPQGIDVSVLCPGWVRTAINDAAKLRPSLQNGGEDREETEQGREIAEAIATGLDPNVVADWTLKRMDEGRFYIFTHPELQPFVEGRFGEIRTDMEASRAVANLALEREAEANNGPLDVLIIGAGFSGVCAAIRLKQEGITNFRVYDKCDGIGGTWWLNTYPGAACDIPSHFYCYSFELNPDWSRLYAPQPEIQKYIEDCAVKYGVRDRIHLGRKITSITFDEEQSLWATTFSNGEVVRSRFVINGSGGLHQPFTPKIDGADEFAGLQMHTARWDHDFDATGKRIAVIGSAASAIQAVPQLAKVADQVTLFQRTPNYIAPREDFAYSPEDQAAFRADAQKMEQVRHEMFVDRDTRLYPIVVNPAIREIAANDIKSFMRSQITDESLQDALMPEYELGCKRILISDDFLPALNRDNVTVETNGVARITSNSIVTDNGHVVPVDAIVYATGFDLESHKHGIQIAGRNKQTLSELWQERTDAYKSSMIPGFPNYFMVTGPNAGVGTTSVVYLIEQSVDWIIDVIKLAGRNSLVEVKSEACQSFSDALQEQLGNTVWASGCDSWYIGSNGRIETLFPGSAQDFATQMAQVTTEDFILTDVPDRTDLPTPNWAPRREEEAQTTDHLTKLDPTIRAIMFSPDAANSPNMAEMTPPEARAYYRALVGKLEAPLSLTCPSEDHVMQLPGRDIAYRIYRPVDDTNAPAMVFFHGGGWVIGDLDTHDNTCRALALGSGVCVISVDYRLAPEHAFPAAVEDAHDAFVWVSQNADHLGLNSDRIGIGGDSAGGNIAAAATLMLRDQAGPACAWQLLVYPAVTAQRDTQSGREFGKGFGLDTELTDWFAAQYLRSNPNPADPRLSPLLAEDHSNLPPAFVATAGFDPLRDEGQSYSERLKSAGVKVEYRSYPDLVHGFASWAGLVPSARAALTEMALGLKILAAQDAAATPA
ncbi:SDR family NAD(P)-dependent oxidoreductase [Alisedimentitalea sp. MJ-SS2]|uniref:SDR family NAD(P)-dependent oxidoreductase n=1 Tax=Aliisedimentitalea sp. MJ-SS2 TaxID=3049795 RepID=UPI00290E87BC|nr:SDR family NAD(P)-dependent oxidoreductase [Alisedimentitalea sp. MJ-SS2]MDU8929117.1 SDR family NAD(P)-dependent oxidoreductase [Alisedimentitalea sp. MJ-SS2]